MLFSNSAFIYALIMSQSLDVRQLITTMYNVSTFTTGSSIPRYVYLFITGVYIERRVQSVIPTTKKWCR